MSPKSSRTIFSIPWMFLFFLPAFSADLVDLSNRLARQAEELAADSYRGFNNRDRGNRADVEILFLVQQFGSGTNLLRRMVDDRRPFSELRNACDLLKQQSRDFSSYPFGRQRTTEIQRLLDEIARELNVSDNAYNRSGTGRERDLSSRRDIPDRQDSGNMRTNPYGDSQTVTTKTGPGKLIWSGKVDHEVHVQVSGNNVYVQVIEGQDVQDMRQEFVGLLPDRSVTVSVKKRKGRGSVQVFEQPSRANGYQAVIRIQDPKGGTDEYEFELTW
jgi:hypothetical protein